METAEATFKCPVFIVQLKLPNSKSGEVLMLIENEASLTEFKSLLTYEAAMDLGLDCEDFEVIGVPSESELHPSFVNYTIEDDGGKPRTLNTFKTWVEENNVQEYFQPESFRGK